jgi:hypothetical protein
MKGRMVKCASTQSYTGSIAVTLMLAATMLASSAMLTASPQESGATAQGPPEQALVSGQAPGAVPQLVRFSGLIKDASGKPRTGSIGLTLSLYAEQAGGSPLWGRNTDGPAGRARAVQRPPRRNTA